MPIASMKELGKGDSIFCCVGTTQKKVKNDKTAYRKVDYDIPVTAAQMAVKNGFKKYLLVSAIGANPNSANFYLQLKGSVEEDIRSLPFESIHIFRPSLLLGNRKEKRTGEKIAQFLLPLLSWAMVGPLRQYRPISGEKVAAAMMQAALSPAMGLHIYQYDQIEISLLCIHIGDHHYAAETFVVVQYGDLVLYLLLASLYQCRVFR